MRQKHGIPALISFFIPGLGQLIKGHIFSALFFFVVCGVTAFLFAWTIIFSFIPFIFWVWNVYNAYNSN